MRCYARNMARRSYRDTGVIARGEDGLRSNFSLILKDIYLGARLFRNSTWSSAREFISDRTFIPDSPPRGPTLSMLSRLNSFKILSLLSGLANLFLFFFFCMILPA
jgi:hypothetical protein